MKNDVTTYDDIKKISADQGDDYTTGWLLDYLYFKNCKMITIYLTKQQALDAKPKATQQITFTVNLYQEATIFSLLKKQKKIFWIFPKKLWESCKFIFLQYNINIKWLTLIR